MIRITEQEFSSFFGRSKNMYNIRSETNEIISYEPNEAQKNLATVRDEEFARNKSRKGINQAKILILKSRQVGGTTDTAMFNGDVMLTLPYAYGLVLAHDEISTQIIYSKYKLWYNNLPEVVEIINEDGTPQLDQFGNPNIIEIKPEIESLSGYQLSFKNLTKSRLLVRTAGSGDNVGKGDTLNYVHLSEAANYEHFNDIYTSVNQSLPKNAFIYSVIESTANGMSGKGEGFYNLWTKSTEEYNRFVSGKIDTFEGYRPVFIPWYDLKKYRLPLHNGKLIDIESINFHTPENKRQFLEMEEKIVEEIFDTRTDGIEAINWYRWCIKENCNYDLNEAKRYYPTTPEDAFIASDSCFFNTAKLFQVKQRYETKEEPDFQRGFVNEDLEFVEHSLGDLKIWQQPDKTYINRYIVSLDPSYGIEGGDYSCMMVYDRLQDEFVAKWYGNLKEDLVAEEFLKLGYFYNEALLIPEMNLRTVITLISPEGLMPYAGEIYTRMVKSRGVEEYGYHTLGNTRLPLLNNYESWLRDDYFKIKDLELIKEHISFVKKVTRGMPRYEAAEGSHDDQVIASALCIEGNLWWDEEMAETTADYTDIKNIIAAPARTNRGVRSGALGLSLPSLSNTKRSRKQSEIGHHA